MNDTTTRARRARPPLRRALLVVAMLVSLGAGGTAHAAPDVAGLGTDGVAQRIAPSAPSDGGASTQSTCAINVGGRQGAYICEYGTTSFYYQGRHHVFLVGTDYAVWHIWQTSVGGGYSNWTSLGGQARSGVYATVYASGALEISVVGTDGNWWCRTYSGGWSGWGRC